MNKLSNIDARNKNGITSFNPYGRSSPKARRINLNGFDIVVQVIVLAIIWGISLAIIGLLK